MLLSCLLSINSWINLSFSWQLFQVYFPNIIYNGISLILLHCMFSASNLFSRKFEKNSFQFETKICEKFKFVINSTRDKNSNFFNESVISFHFVNLFSDSASWLYQSVTNNLEIDQGFSLLLYLKFFRNQPTGIAFESI